MAFLKLKSLFLISIFLVVLFIVHLATAADSQVASVKVQYKKNIILYCGDGPQYDQKFAKDNVEDKDDDDDDDNDGNSDDEDEDDGDDDDERKKNLWKDVQFYKSPPKSANASGESTPELIVPDGRLFIFNPKRNSLKIHFPKRAEIESSYFCNSSAPQKTIAFQFLILPYLYMPEAASYSHFEGENETLHCKALFGFEGDQTLEWKWKYGDKVLESEGNTTVEVDKVIHNSSLIIQNLDDKQKGRYKCIVSNKHGSHSRTIILRIKERYGFLWPLIGSLIVLLLLVLVVLFAEMRQRRKERKQRAD